MNAACSAFGKGLKGCFLDLHQVYARSGLSRQGPVTRATSAMAAPCHCTQGKVVFVAPTRPLVNQQIDACYRCMGVSKTAMAELTGRCCSAGRQAGGRAGKWAGGQAGGRDHRNREGRGP